METYEVEFKVLTVDDEDIAEGVLDCCYRVYINGLKEWVGCDKSLIEEGLTLVEGETYKGLLTVEGIPSSMFKFRRIVEVYV